MPPPKLEPPSLAARKKAFGQALDGALAAAGMTQVELAKKVGVQQPAVSTWVNGSKLPEDPQIIFAIEEAVGAKPGSLSIHLGYLPPAAVKVSASFLRAIDDDPQLDDDARQLLRNTYRMMIKGSGRRGRPSGA